MNIKLFREAGIPTHLTGGEYATADINIYIDPTLDIREQRILVIHTVIENYNRSMPHDKVEELCGFIEDALDLLEDIRG